MKKCPKCNSSRWRENDKERFCEKCGFKNDKNSYESAEVKTEEISQEGIKTLIFGVQITDNIFSQIMSKISKEHLHNRINNIIRGELHKIFTELSKEEFGIVSPKEADVWKKERPTSKIITVKQAVMDLHRERGDWTIKNLYEKLQNKDIEIEKIDQIVKQMLEQGEIYRPNHFTYRRMR